MEYSTRRRVVIVRVGAGRRGFERFFSEFLSCIDAGSGTSGDGLRIFSRIASALFRAISNMALIVNSSLFHAVRRTSIGR
jgi:hypothetical protein